jgi:multiple sugar transport system permease protein
MAVIFFVIIVALSFILMMVRQRTNWSDTETR